MVRKDASQIARNLQERARLADILMIWTDCDREGEHIGSEIVSICCKAKRNLPVKRAKFSAIIASQIHHALQHPIELDWNAVAAVESRIELDLRLGAAFTRLQSLGLQSHFQELKQKVISYGPCQFPTLGFVVEQYYKVMDFVPEPFWYISVTKKRSNMNVDFRWSRNHLFVEQEVTTIYNRCIANPEATVSKVITKQTRKFKPQPLTTVELQKAGGRLLRMAPKRVLDVAEKLYQRGLLSYPRTETDQYDPAFDLRSYIDKQKNHPDWGPFAVQLSQEGTSAFEKPINGSKNDKAHPPIHPTKPAIDLSGDEKRVYEFVTRRFLASCSKHAVGKQTTVSLDIADEKFTANGVVVVERNYLEVFPYDSWGGPALPEFQEGERFTPTKIEKKEGETSRPKLLTEADLVSLMDRHGIGTDATIAEHIAKIIEREYVMIQPEGQIKYLVPSTLGMGLVEGYNSIELQDEKSLCKPMLRRETEERMGLICEGLRTKQDTVRESLEQYHAVFTNVQGHMQKLITSMARYLRGEQQDGLADRRPLFEDRPAPHGPRDDDDDDDAPPPPFPGAGRSELGTNLSRRSGIQRQSADVIELDDDDDPSIEMIERPQISYGPSLSFVPSAQQFPTPRMQDRPAESDAIQCRCGDAARQRVVQKDGHNKGRRFWSCTKSASEDCGFFQWSDEAANGISVTGNGTGSASRSNGIVRPADDTAVRRCECQLEAKRLVASKAGPNQGRAFWMCPNISKIAQCRYFEWDDEMPRQESNAGQASSMQALTGRDNVQTCFNCGQTGHWAGQCTGAAQARTDSLQRKPPNRRGGQAGQQACFTCGQAGHWSNACPQKGVAGNSGGSGGGPSNSVTNTFIGRSTHGGRDAGGSGTRQGSCFKCGGKGHWSTECTNGEETSTSRTSGRGAGRGGGRTKRRKT